MAAHRFITRRLISVALAASLAVLTALPPGAAQAYDNMSAHPKINSEAVVRFQERAKQDEWLSGTSLDGSRTFGPAITEVGLLSAKEELREMTVAEWLAHGGMSADEPELPASFRHFYDPLRLAKVAYLTDHIDDLLEFGWGVGKTAVPSNLPDQENPKVDARSWALSHPENPWTYAKAIEYFRAAMAQQQRLSDGDLGKPIGTNPDYAKAWRAVGETMHLMADMTVPAHVRNDSHPYVPALGYKLGNPDPYESTIRAAEITAHAGGVPASSITYDNEDLLNLFDEVARWTNENFFSIDTVPLPGRTTTYNGQPPYPSPGLDAGFVTTSHTYFVREIDGEPVPIIRRSMLVTLGMVVPKALDLKEMVWPSQVYSMDLAILEAQRSFLIPTAIEASSWVLQAFLPRLKVDFTAEQMAMDKILVQGRLLHEPTLAWPVTPAINNGAYIEYVPAGFNDVHRVWMPDSAFRKGNQIEYELDAEPGTLVSLNWDLGGYVIKTDRRVVRGVSLKVLPESIGEIDEGSEVYLEAEVSDIPKSMRRIDLEWSFGDSTDAVSAHLPVGGTGSYGEANHEVSHAYEKGGDYTLRVRALSSETGEVLAEVTRTIKVKQEQITVQIYPRSLSGQPGQTLEASALPSNDKYRYEWSFGDGNSSAADGASVARHAWSGKGTYDLVLKLFRAGAGAGAIPLAQDRIKVEIIDQPGGGTGGGTGGTGTPEPGKVYVWRLVQIQHLDNKAGWEAQHAGAAPWNFNWSYGTGSFYARVWLKDDKNYIAFGAKATWSGPPEVIRAGDKVSMSATLSTTENTHQWNTSSAATWAKFCQPGLGLGARGWDDISFKSAAGNDNVAINGAGVTSATETLTAIAPAGKVGARIALRLEYYMGSSMGTSYIYEWQPY
jgi:hypothetical protein